MTNEAMLLTIGALIAFLFIVGIFASCRSKRLKATENDEAKLD